MKLKTILLLMAAAVATASCSARDIYSTDASALPHSAKAVIDKNFSSTGVNHIKIDKGVFGVEGYDVILADGTEVEFDSKGALKEVDCSRNGNVPDALVPKAILDYVARSYNGQRIVKLDVKRNGYEIELQSGVDLVFDKNGTFKRIDD